MRVFVVLGRVLGKVRWVVHGLEKIKKWEDENPDKIDKVPEESADLDPISQMLRIALVKFFTDRQPHVNENQDAGEHMRPMQSGNGEVTCEICAVPRAERINALNVFLLDLRDVVGWRNVKKVWTVGRWVVWIHEHRTEPDVGSPATRILNRFRIAQAASDRASRLTPFFP